MLFICRSICIRNIVLAQGILLHSCRQQNARSGCTIRVIKYLKHERLVMAIVRTLYCTYVLASTGFLIERLLPFLIDMTCLATFFSDIKSLHNSDTNRNTAITASQHLSIYVQTKNAQETL